MAGMRGQAWVQHLLDARVAVEELGDRPAVLGVLLHPQRQRLDSAQHEPAVERPGNGPERLLQERQALGDGRIVGGDEAADDIGVPAEVFRRRVDDDVGAELERLLQVRARERVVHDEHRAGGVCRLSGSADVDDVQERVRGRLGPHDPRPLVEVCAEVRVELVGRDVDEVVALGLVDLRRHPVDAAVDICDEDDLLAGIDEVHQGRGRAEPRRVRDPVLGALERGDADLQRSPRRIRDPRVVVALVLSDRLLHVRGGLVDGDRDRAGGGIGILAYVDRACLEVHARILRTGLERPPALQARVRGTRACTPGPDTLPPTDLPRA